MKNNYKKAFNDWILNSRVLYLTYLQLEAASLSIPVQVYHWGRYDLIVQKGNTCILFISHCWGNGEPEEVEETAWNYI